MIREANLEDATAIASIYKYYVEETTITYEIEPPDASEMAERWRKISANYPYLVMEEQGKVIGYAYTSRFRERKAFDPATEVAIYFAKDFCGNGRGKLLLTALLQELEKYNYATAVACISSNNVISNVFFTKMGFKLAGVLENVAYKKDQWLGLAEYTRPLENGYMNK